VERDLVVAAIAGDRDAFTALAAASVDRLYRVAFRIMRDPDDARDATQQALLEAWRDLSSLRDPGRWEAWTYRLVVRGCYRAGRRGRRITLVPLLPSDEPTGPDTSAAILDRDALERAFRQLPIDQRAVVVLHHHVGLSLVEVARLLGIPDGTARSRLHAATRRLRASIEPDRAEVTAPEGRTA
jgi:RNA polymerase sigma-70 factor (ECF subfamily)